MWLAKAWSFITSCSESSLMFSVCKAVDRIRKIPWRERTTKGNQQWPAFLSTWQAVAESFEREWCTIGWGIRYPARGIWAFKWLVHIAVIVCSVLNVRYEIPKIVSFSTTSPPDVCEECRLEKFVLRLSTCLVLICFIRLLTMQEFVVIVEPRKVSAESSRKRPRRRSTVENKEYRVSRQTSIKDLKVEVLLSTRRNALFYS